MKGIDAYISTTERISSIDNYISTAERISSIDDYISEKLHINNTTKIEYMYHPKNKEELIECIKEKIDKEGLGTKDNPLDLNDIDTSKITDMHELFDVVDGNLPDLSENGNFDISDWNVSNVINMAYMFFNSNFNGDISNWDVSKVEDMLFIFGNCPLKNNPPKWYK